MPRAKKATAASAETTHAVDSKPVSLAAMLSSATTYRKFSMWLVGDTPLICHAWSHKAKLQMLQKQVGAVKAGKEPRDPEQDFVDSLYEMKPDSGVFGFPLTGFKRAFLSVAHKDRGTPKVTLQQSFWLDAEIVSVRPALAGAICNVPLVRIYGSKPLMREDMGRIGAGPTKTANLIYRAEFDVWAVKLTGRYNPARLDDLKLATLVMDSGLATGIGEWRNEKNGIFGAYHIADSEEEKLWEAYAANRGPLPLPNSGFAEAAE